MIHGNLTNYSNTANKSRVVTSNKARGRTRFWDKAKQIGHRIVEAANDVDHATGNAISKHLFGNDKSDLAKVAATHPEKTTAALVAAGVDSDVGMEYLHELALNEEWDKKLKPVFDRSLEMAKEMAAKAGLDDPTPDVDAKVADRSIDQIDADILLFREAERVYKRASSIVGGEERLIALMDWLTIDPDLQALVIRHASRS